MTRKMNIKDVFVRAGKTFIQSTLAVVVASGTDYISIDTWQAAVIGAGAATLSALYNGLREFFGTEETDAH